MKLIALLAVLVALAAAIAQFTWVDDDHGAQAASWHEVTFAPDGWSWGDDPQ